MLLIFLDGISNLDGNGPLSNYPLAGRIFRNAHLRVRIQLY